MQLWRISRCYHNNSFSTSRYIPHTNRSHRGSAAHLFYPLSLVSSCPSSLAFFSCASSSTSLGSAFSKKKMAAYKDFCARVEAIIGQDIGNRGIAALQCPGDLAKAAIDFVNAEKGIVILTGFPCLMTRTPPTETDGPSGSVAIANASMKLKKNTALVTDVSSASVLEATAAAIGLKASVFTTTTSALPSFELHFFSPPPPPAKASSSSTASLPSCESTNLQAASNSTLYPVSNKEEEWEEGERWKQLHTAKLLDLVHRYDHAVAIERAGRAVCGGYRTMRGYSMNAFVAPIDELLTIGTTATSRESSSNSNTESLQQALPPPPTASSSSSSSSSSSTTSLLKRTSTGIGDGGNECGMGKVLENVRAHIKNGPIIACTVPADNLIAAGVSNWGGWGLCAAVEACIRYAGVVIPSKDAAYSLLPVSSNGEDAPPLQQHQFSLATERSDPVFAHSANNSMNASNRIAAAASFITTIPVGGLLPTDEEETALVKAMNDAGAADGISGSLDGSIDGMPLETHLKILRSLRKLLKDEFQ